MHPTEQSRTHRRRGVSVNGIHRAVQSHLCSQQAHRTWKRHRDRSQHSCSRNPFPLSILGDLVGQVIFICLAIALYRLLSNVNRTWALLMVGFVLVSAAVGFLNTLNNIAGLILFRGGEFLIVFDTAQRNALGMLFIVCILRETLSQRSSGAMALSFWVVRLSLRVFAPLHRRLVNDQLFRLCGSQHDRVILSPLLQRCFWLPPTVLFGELAIMLWLLIKGAKVPPLELATVQMKTA